MIPYFLMLAMYYAENDFQLWKIVAWDHSDHQFWTPYIWSSLWIMLSCIVCERQKFSESHKLKHFGARNQLICEMH